MAYRITLNIIVYFLFFIELTLMSCSNRRIERLYTGNDNTLKILVFRDNENFIQKFNLYKEFQIKNKKLKIDSINSDGLVLVKDKGGMILSEGIVLPKKVNVELVDKKYFYYYQFFVQGKKYRVQFYNIFQKVDFFKQESLVINKSLCKFDKCILNTGILYRDDLKIFIQSKEKIYDNVMMTLGIDVFLDVTNLPEGENYTLIMEGHNLSMKKNISIRR